MPNIPQKGLTPEQIEKLKKLAKKGFDAYYKFRTHPLVRPILSSPVKKKEAKSLYQHLKEQKEYKEDIIRKFDEGKL